MSSQCVTKLTALGIKPPVQVEIINAVKFARSSSPSRKKLVYDHCEDQREQQKAEELSEIKSKL